MSSTAGAPPTITTSRHFPAWLAGQGGSLGFSTYQAGKVFLVGCRTDGGLSIFERTLNRCMGLCIDGDGIWISTLYQVWYFRNMLGAGQVHEGFDRLYAPRASWVTGDLDVHDMVPGPEGRPVFVNTLFSCLATLSESHSFVPLWTPPFITRLAPEDRCHLNGLAARDGEPRYVTAVSTSNVSDGWRDRRRDGGVVVDVRSGEILCDGLSMPHSPRWHNGSLWLLNSGTGEFGRVDLERGRFEPIAFLPGYLRGLCFIGDHAVVGLSRPREQSSFSGLALQQRLLDEGVEARCGLQVVDLKSGDAPHWMRLDGIVEELYDVVSIPGVRRPMALGFQSEEVQRFFSVGDPPPAP